MQKRRIYFIYLNRSQCSILFVHIIWNIPIDIPLIFIDSIFLDVSMYPSINCYRSATANKYNFPYYTRFDSIRKLRKEFLKSCTLNRFERNSILFFFENFILLRTRRIRYIVEFSHRRKFTSLTHGMGHLAAIVQTITLAKKYRNFFFPTLSWKIAYCDACQSIIEKTYGDNLIFFSK